jgi:hypothetical protein
VSTLQVSTRQVSTRQVSTQTSFEASELAGAALPGTVGASPPDWASLVVPGTVTVGVALTPLAASRLMLDVGPDA